LQRANAPAAVTSIDIDCSSPIRPSSALGYVVDMSESLRVTIVYEPGDGAYGRQRTREHARGGGDRRRAGATRSA